MTISKNDAITQLESYIKSKDKSLGSLFGRYTNWYVGITSNPERKLFQEHGVSRQDDSSWICCPCFSAEDAKFVENYIVANLHTDGDISSGDQKSLYVYAVLKQPYMEKPRSRTSYFLLHEVTRHVN